MRAFNICALIFLVPLQGKFFMARLTKIVLIIVALVVLSSVDAEAQCAMCRRIAESNLNDSTAAVAKNLNPAILYLMSLPYLVLGALAWLFYRNMKAKKAEENALQA